MGIKWGLSKKILVGCMLLIVLPLSIMGFRFVKSGSELVQQKLAEANWKSVRSFDTYFLDKVNSDLKFFLEIWADNDDLNKIAADEVLEEKYQKEWENALLGYPEVASIYFGDLEGNVFIVPEYDFPEDYNALERVWYQDALLSDGKVAWTRPYKDIVTDEYIFSVSKQVFDERGEPSGVMAIDVKLSEMVAFVELEKISENGELILISEAGDVIVGQEGITDIRHYSWAERILNESEGAFPFEIDGKTLYISFSTNQTTGWKLIGLIPETDLDVEMQPLENLFIRVILIVTLWGILVVVALIYSSSKLVVKPIQELMGYMGAAESGNMTLNSTPHVNRTDEMGALFRSFNHMIEGQRQMLVQVLVTATKLSGTADQTSAVAKLGNSNAVSQSSAMMEMSESLSALTDSIGEVSNNVSEIAEKLNLFTIGMQDLGSSSADVAQVTIETAEAVSDMVKALSAFENSNQSIHNNVDIASDKGDEACGFADQGKVVVSRAMLEMGHINEGMASLAQIIETLGESALQIGEIIEVIEDITEQTSLLSLNASIEAARAGEQGKGFSVVANAIGRLSDKSKSSTKDVEKIVRSIQVIVSEATNRAELTSDQIKMGVELTRDIEVAFDRINKSIVETSEFLKRIAIEGQTQRESGQEIMKAIERVNDHTMQVSASTEENVSTIEEFVTTIESMNRITQEVSESGKEQVESTQLLSNTSLTLNQMTTDLKHMGEDVALISHELSVQAKELVELVSKFKL